MIMVDVPQSNKKKKRIRSLFSPEQSKLIRTKALPPSGSDKEVSLQEKDDKEGELKSKSSSEGEETYRFELDLSCDREAGNYPEISFSQLIQAEQKSEDEELSEDEDPDVKRMSEYFEKKYGGDGARRRMTDVNIDHGYDTSDPFVDDSEAFDEVIPDELDTQHGGFYINFGDLLFKKVELSESDEEPVQIQNRKRKRDEEDRKQLHKKMKTMKIKEKYKKMDKEVKLKKKKVIVEDDSSDSDLQRPTKPTKLKKPAVKQTQKKQKEKTKETNAHNKKSSEVKAKKAEKKPSAEKKVAKKKSKDILEEESAKVLDIVEKNKPLGEDNLSLISDNLACIEFELRRNHSHSRRAFYEELIKKMGEDCQLDYNKIKNTAFSSLTKKNAATLEETTIPLKKAVAALMAEMLPAFEKRKSVYQEKMESWKSAQAEQNPGEELVKPKAPAKYFKWDETTRALYGKVVQVKFAQLKLIRVKPDDQADLMKRYMKSLVEEVWPSGWMTTTVLTKEAQPYCKLFSNGKAPKKKPTVTANPMKNSAKPTKLKTEAAKPKAESAKPKAESAKPKVESAKPKSEPTKPKSEQPAKQNSKSVLTEKAVSKFDAAFSDSPKSSGSSSNTNGKPPKERTPSNTPDRTLSPAPSHKTNTTTTKNTSKTPVISASKSKDFSADIAIIKSNINKINANLNKTVPSITISDKSKSPSPTTPTPSRPTKTAVLKLNPAKPQPKSAKTASDRPIVSVPAMSHLITPRGAAPVKLTSDHITSDFINNLLKKYGAERLQQIKSQGLFPALLKEELLQVKSNSNAVIIIDDDAASPKKSSPPPRKSVTSSPSNMTSSPGCMTASPSHMTSSPNRMTVSPGNMTSSPSNMTSSRNTMSSPSGVASTSVKSSISSQKSTTSPKTIAAKNSCPSSSMNSSVLSKSEHTRSNTISVIEKSCKAASSVSSDRRTVSPSSASTPRHTIPVNVSTTPIRTSLDKSANPTANPTANLTDSRPSILITKSTLPTPIPKSVTSTGPSSSLKPGISLSNTNLQSRLSQLMNSTPALQPQSQSSANTCVNPQKQQPAVSRPVLCISKPAGYPATNSKPAASSLSLPKGGPGAISLGTILSQHPQIDSQTLNKNILKSVAAKLQSFKESKEKE